MRNEIPVVKIKTKDGRVANYVVIGGNYYYFGDDSMKLVGDNWLRMYFRVNLLEPDGGCLKVIRDCNRYTPEQIKVIRGVKRIPKPFIYRYVP